LFEFYLTPTLSFGEGWGEVVLNGLLVFFISLLKRFIKLSGSKVLRRGGDLGGCIL
jgi:hypothetical protein